MLETIAEHIVDLSLLPEKAIILDAGCRGFAFTKHMRSLGHRVLAIDIEENISGSDYFVVALTGFNGRGKIVKNNDPNATRIVKDDNGPVMCVTIQKLCEQFAIDFFDLIKMDIEGQEMEVILSMDKPYAKQLSFEMHLHTGTYGLMEVKLMEDKLTSLGYFPASHEMTKQHGLGLNYWSSLWVLK